MAVLGRGVTSVSSQVNRPISTTFKVGCLTESAVEGTRPSPQHTEKQHSPMLAIKPLEWPGMNQAFLFSFAVTVAMGLAVIPYGKRRKVGKPVTWGEAMLGSVYVFFVWFLAFGVVPHQWIDHADKNLGWRKDKIIYGPFNLLQPDTYGGSFPITISYEALRDVIVVVIHVIFFAITIFIVSWWQKRGAVQTKELEQSTYGRPLVRKS